MNIMITSDGDAKYGASHSLLNMAVSLKRMNNDVTVVLNQESQIAQALRSEGCKVNIIKYIPYYQNVPEKRWKLPFKYILKGIIYWLTRLNIINSTRDIMKSERFDIIHSNSSREDVGAILSQYYKIPLIWHIREFGDLDYRCYSYRRDYISYINRSATQIIAISNAVKKHWVSKGIIENKIRVVYNGVENNEYHRKEKHIHQNGIKVVMVGSVLETKGQIQAVKAMIEACGIEKYRIITLDIIGDGSRTYIKRLRKLINSSGMQDRIRLLGYKKNIKDLLGDYDIGLVCSRSEGFGRVTAEYMMAGLAVIVSDTGANAEVMREGVDGLIYHYGDTHNLATRILEVVKHLDNYGGLQTHEFAKSHFSAEINAQNVFAVYNEAICESASVL